MDQIIVSAIYYLLSLYFFKYLHNTYMLIHIGYSSNMYTLYRNGGSIYDIFYCRIIFLRKGSSSAHECYDLYITTIVCYLRCLITYFNCKHVIYYWSICLMVNITINDYSVKNLPAVIIINHDGYK